MASASSSNWGCDFFSIVTRSVTELGRITALIALALGQLERCVRHDPLTSLHPLPRCDQCVVEREVVVRVVQAGREQ